MAIEFEKYGKTKAEPFRSEPHIKVPALNTVQGGDVDPFGDVEKKDSMAINMNAAEAFNKKKLYTVEVMGTDEAKKGNPGAKSGNNGDHFKTEKANEDIDAFGTDCGKSKSGHSDRA